MGIRRDGEMERDMKYFIYYTTTMMEQFFSSMKLHRDDKPQHAHTVHTHISHDSCECATEQNDNLRFDVSRMYRFLEFLNAAMT